MGVHEFPNGNRFPSDILVSTLKTKNKWVVVRRVTYPLFSMTSVKLKAYKPTGIVQL